MGFKISSRKVYFWRGRDVKGKSLLCVNLDLRTRRLVLASASNIDMVHEWDIRLNSLIHRGTSHGPIFTNYKYFAGLSQTKYVDAEKVLEIFPLKVMCVNT